MIRRFKLTLFALFCFLVVGQFIGTGAYSQDPPAEKFFKNIQALKGIPASKIGGLMDSYNKALGVSCDYCHVAGDLTKGDKPAHKTAVQDITMTREISEKYKHTAIDCMFCHQGKAKPGGSMAGPGPGPGPGVKTDEKTFTASQGNVFFPHGAHKMDCTKCHHQGGNIACAQCHKHNNGDTGLSFKKVSHSPTSTRGCTGCHTQMNVGPKACNTCHKQEGGGGGGGGTGPDMLSFRAIALGGSVKVAFPHAKHVEIAGNDCTKCHHQGPIGKCDGCHKHNNGDIGLSFKKTSHTTKARGCTGCHLQSGSGPSKCTECHKK